MTQIHGNAPPKDRLDDSAVMQRRLLQDLERQWLDTWGQAQQLQPQAGFQMEASNAEADSSARVNASRLASPQAQGNAGTRVDAKNDGRHADSRAPTTLAKEGARLPQSAGAGTGASASANESTSRSTTLASLESVKSLAGPAAFEGTLRAALESDLANGSTSRPATVVSLKSVQSLPRPAAFEGAYGAALESAGAVKDPVPGASDRGASAVIGETMDAIESAGAVKDPVPGASDRGASAVIGETTDAKVAMPTVSISMQPLVPLDANAGSHMTGLEIDRRSWGAQASIRGAAPEQALAVATVTSTTSETAHIALLSEGPSALPSSIEEGDAEASARARPRFSATNPESEPASQHLMLRELNEQQVLASMRDAQLNSLESQVAAQELARALMQAGYARVQVVVNGHQRRHGDAAVEDGMASDGSSSAEPAPQQTSNIQTTPHGN
ncbi:hypothetical protein [Roseateles sp. P5_E11]